MEVSRDIVAPDARRPTRVVAGRRGSSFLTSFRDATCLPALRGWLREVLPDRDDDALIDAELVCTELVTNAVDHARGPCEVRVHLYDAATLTVEVDDASPCATLIVGTSRFGRRRGRGLVMVDALSRWGVWRGTAGKTVWASLSVA